MLILTSTHGVEVAFSCMRPGHAYSKDTHIPFPCSVEEHGMGAHLDDVLDTELLTSQLNTLDSTCDLLECDVSREIWTAMLGFNIDGEG